MIEDLALSGVDRVERSLGKKAALRTLAPLIDTLPAGERASARAPARHRVRGGARRGRAARDLCARWIADGDRALEARRLVVRLAGEGRAAAAAQLAEAEVLPHGRPVRRGRGALRARALPRERGPAGGGAARARDGGAPRRRAAAAASAGGRAGGARALGARARGRGGGARRGPAPARAGRAGGPPRGGGPGARLAGTLPARRGARRARAAGAEGAASSARPRCAGRRGTPSARASR
ncbi:MAG: hypothetical protein M5U28_03635 [Sandaracinaceae bacterium]|nr:hypothetical protein [Sandaracinaceae bacterium]